MTAMGIASVGGFSIVVANSTRNTELVTSVNRYSGVQFLNDGTYNWLTGNQSGPLVGANAPWSRPSGTQAAPMMYDLFTTLTSGTLDVGSGALGSWIPMDVSAPLYAVQGMTAHQAVLGLQFRNRGSGIVMGTASITIALIPPP